jgi:transcriptional regulator with XRE-family HTH domain
MGGPLNGQRIKAIDTCDACRTNPSRDSEYLIIKILLSNKKSINAIMNADLIPTLAAARKAHQMTQAQLAESAGLSRMTVQRTEGGDLDPRYSTLAEMARVLGMDIIAVPSSLRPSLEAFIQSGGKFLGQPEGVDAPPSVVDGLRG